MNFLMGGKLGDFLHALFAVKCICHQHNTKANVYMYDIGWEFGIQNTYKELYDIIINQDYINSFDILTEYEIDPIQTSEQNTPIRINNAKILNDGYIDLGNYIRSPWLYKACWSDLYSKTFNFNITDEYKWLSYDKIDTSLQNKVLIHRRNNPVRINNEFPYDHVLETYKDNVIFISSDRKDYDAFNREIPFLQVSTLDEWFTSINSCSMIISNLSSPAVIGHALDKLRIIELPNIPDAAHCIGEEQYSKNIHWFLNNTVNNL